MNQINNKANFLIKSTLGADFLEKTVTREWQNKSKCLANLTNENKDQLKKIELQLLKDLEYNGLPAEPQWKELKQSTIITPTHKKFAKFLYEEYPKHSLKIMGF